MSYDSFLRFNLKNIQSQDITIPGEPVFEPPEKYCTEPVYCCVDWPDYFIDKANRAGIFNGRIVVVKSTASGDSAALNTGRLVYPV